MKITIEKISYYNQPCEAGVEWLKLQKDHMLSALVKTVIENKPFKYGNKIWYPLDFAMWVFPQLMDKQGAVLYAVYAARLVLKSGDTRLVKAIDAAEAWLKNPCEETRLAAGTAEAAALAATTARTAALAAEKAAKAAGAAAEAIKLETQIKILRYGVKLLWEEKKEHNNDNYK